jgi:hypothetical protein
MDSTMENLNERLKIVGRDVSRLVDGAIIQQDFEAREVVSGILHEVDDYLQQHPSVPPETLKAMIEQLIILSQLVRINPDAVAVLAETVKDLWEWEGVALAATMHATMAPQFFGEFLDRLANDRKLDLIEATVLTIGGFGRSPLSWGFASFVEALGHVVDQSNVKTMCVVLDLTGETFYRACTRRPPWQVAWWQDAVDFFVKRLIQYTGRRAVAAIAESHCQIAHFLLSALDGDLTSCPQLTATLLMLPETVLDQFEPSRAGVVLDTITNGEAVFGLVETIVKWGLARFKTAATAATQDREPS